MFKKIFFTGLMLGLVAILLAGGIIRTQAVAAEGNIGGNGRGNGRGNGSQVNAQDDGQGNGYQGGSRNAAEDCDEGSVQGNQGGDGVGDANSLPPADPTGLSDAEAAGLLFMREEEKLARDVYNAFYDMYGLNVFANIARSEQQHMDSVKTLLDRYGREDPASSQPGVFTASDLQALYDQLLAQGSFSLVEAVKVGALIEEVDIQDLIVHLAATENADIRAVYANLLKGSGNHLKAFVNQWTAQTGTAYVPQLLTQAEYDEILATAGGGGYGGGRRGNGD